MSESKSNTGCIVAAILGGVGCLGAVFVIGVAAAMLFVTRAAPVPVATAAPPPVATEVPPAVESEPEPPLDEPDAGELPSGVSVETKHEDYTIRGASADALRSDLARLGPKDQEGSHHAYTRWHVRWSYPYERNAGSCATGKVSVSVAVTFIMPKWEPPADAPAELVERWQKYEKALERHENGHKEHGLGAARDVLRKLEKLDAEPDCDSMNREANAAANRIVEEYKAKDKAYDKETRHGATQGARFP
ncbi:MAG: DUF922 domain-containing Zn-dependent protease [Myxococcales bacterium]|nr:DUF922 domain-containing Zn-dependent protease [Myxococcales bacterium]